MVRTDRAIVLSLVLSFSLLTAGCASNNPAISTPTPPQVSVASSVNLLAQSLDAATKGLIAANKAGSLSDADLKTAEAVARIIATTGKAINAELRSSDTWDIQKAAILRIIANAGISAAMKNLPPNAAALLAASLTAFNQISSSVGGPTI